MRTTNTGLGGQRRKKRIQLVKRSKFQRPFYPGLKSGATKWNRGYASAEGFVLAMSFILQHEYPIVELSLLTNITADA